MRSNDVSKQREQAALNGIIRLLDLIHKLKIINDTIWLAGHDDKWKFIEPYVPGGW